MRILRLDLRAFGPFTEVTIDLSQGSEGVHVIYGPNEAGKSSALRALEQMLFGIPPRSSDDFVHSYQNLRIGATLCNRGGKPVSFLRRKRAKNTLFAADDVTPLDDSILAPLLGGLDQELFSTMFGIGHQQLVRGGMEIVHGSGNVGQILFAAGAGIADLQSIQAQLEREAGDLFLPRASTRRINQNLKAYDDARKKIRQGQLPSEEWERHQQALSDARSRRTEIDVRLLARQAEKNRLGRIVQALPVIARREELRRQHEDLRGVPLLRAGFAEQRSDAVTKLALARSAQRKAQEELDRIAKELQSLEVPESLLAHAAQIERLSDELGSYRKAQRDLPALRAGREQLDRDAAAILQRIRPDLTPETVEGLRLTDPQKLAIQKLGKRHEAVLLKLQQARQEIEDTARETTRLQTQVVAIPEPADTGPLKDAIRRVQNQGDLEAQLADARLKLGKLQKQTAVELARLPLWSGTLAELEKIAIPPGEAIERFAAQDSAAEKSLGRLNEEIEELHRRSNVSEQKLEQIQLEGEVPTEEDLAAARRLRGQGWRLVLEGWREGSPNTERLAEFLEHFPVTPDLAQAFPRSMEAADEVSDRLRREANRVAQQAGLVAERHALQRERDRATERLQWAVTDHEKIIAEWKACWHPAGIEPLAPQGMQAWIVQYRSLIQQAEAIRSQQDAVEQIASRIQTCCTELAQCLDDLRGPNRTCGTGVPPARIAAEAAAPQDGALHAWLQRAQTTLDRLTAAADRREKLHRELQKLKSGLSAAQARAERAETDLNAWRQQWVVAIAPLGLSPDTAPEMADHVLAQTSEIFERLGRAQDLSDRIEGMTRDAEDFRRRVEELAERTAEDLARLSFERAAEQLLARLQKASHDRQKRDDLKQQSRRYQEEHEKARQAIEGLSARLETMCQEAGCRTPEELPQIEQSSAAVTRIRENLQSLDDQLAALSAGAALDCFVSEAEVINADELPGEIQRLSEEIRGLESQRDNFLGTIAVEEQALAAMDSGDETTEAAEEAQDILSRIEGDALQYIRLRLATAVLRDGIERYRKKNEGPVLQKASALFRRLTGESFQGLIADFDDSGQRALKGVRPEKGKTVELAGMSDGTADQLYLALRLASLESYLDGKEPAPFVLDDLLISFDDDRAATALEVLAEFSRRTQVIFFTHHDHLVELARQRLDPNVLFVHTLDRAAGVARAEQRRA